MNFNSILMQILWKQSIYCSTCQWKGVPSQFLFIVQPYKSTYICWSFCRPDVWFNVKVLKSLQIMEVPLLKSWIQANIDDGITKGLYLSVNSRKVFDIREHLSNILFIYLLKSYFVALVDPGKIDIPIVRYAGPLKQRVASKSKQNKLGESICMILLYLFFCNRYLHIFSEYIKSMYNYFQHKGFWPLL